MPDFPMESPYDTSKVLLANMLTGQGGAALRSVFTPNKLTPRERETLADKFGLTGPFRELVNFVTNPVILVPLIATAVFPLPTAKGLLGFFGKTKMASRLTEPIIQFLGNFDEKLAGTGTEVIKNYYAILQRLGRVNT